MFRVIGDLDALSLYYLDLQKLQHRGEEGADIVVSDIGGKLNTYTVMDLGLVEDVFHDPAPLAKLPRNKSIKLTAKIIESTYRSFMNIRRLPLAQVCHG
jgi:amidophosphoribosyltransferase